MYQKDKFRFNRILVKLGLLILTLGIPGAVLISFKILPEPTYLPFLFLLVFCGAGLVGWFGSTLCYDEKPFWTSPIEDLLGLLTFFWGVPDVTSKEELKDVHIDVIAPLSYGCTRRDLTLATRNNFIKALELRAEHPEAVIITGNAANCFPGSERLEHSLKKKIAAGYKVPNYTLLFRTIINTVTEAWEREKVAQINPAIVSNIIVIITGIIHSRSARYIHKKVSPASRIIIYCPPDTIETQPDQTIVLLKSPWRWVFANIARQIFLRVMGLERTSKFTHPTTINTIKLT